MIKFIFVPTNRAVLLGCQPFISPDISKGKKNSVLNLSNDLHNQSPLIHFWLRWHLTLILYNMQKKKGIHLVLQMIKMAISPWTIMRSPLIIDQCYSAMSYQHSLGCWSDSFPGIDGHDVPVLQIRAVFNQTAASPSCAALLSSALSVSK